MKRRTFNKLLGAGLLAGAAPTIIRGAAAADPFGVGFIYVGPVEDFGWTHAHDVARKAIEEELGAAVKTTYVESVKEGPDAERSAALVWAYKLIGELAIATVLLAAAQQSQQKHPAER